LGEFLPLADKNESGATHKEDFCEKKVAKSLGFEGKVSDFAIFGQYIPADCKKYGTILELLYFPH
jgi:hypothetical protein